MGPKFNRTGVLIREKFGHRERQRQAKMDDEGSDWSDVSGSQGTPRVASNAQKLEEGPKTDAPSEPPEATNPDDTLISHSGLQNCGRINLFCFKPPSL